MAATVADPEPRRVLVIHVSRIGDTLLATPALRAIAHAWPKAEITVLGHPKRVEILEHLPFLRRVGSITKQRARWRGWLARHYDLSFIYGFDEALVAYGLRTARRAIAFRQGDEDLNSRLFRAVEVPAFQSEHSVLQLLRLPAAAGISPRGLRLTYQVTPDEARAAHARLMAVGAQGCRPLIGLQIASFPTKAYRDWPVEHFAQLCERIAKRWLDSHFLIFGGGEERDRTAWLQQRLGIRASLFAGSLSLRETATLMSLTDLYVGVDTGPTHLMSAFDIPLVGLYHGYSRSELIAPLEHPCLYAIDHPRAGPDCPPEAPMAEIAVDTVFAQVERALTEHPPRPR
jgi:heptosyltransferase-3